MEARRLLMFVLCVVAAMVGTHCKQKPKPASSYFTICKKQSQDKFDECVKNSIMEARPILKNGIPALGLVPLDPMIIPKMVLNQGSGSFGLNTTMTNFTFHGLSRFEITKAHFVVRPTEGTFSFDLDMKTPKVETTALYEMNGQILVLPIRGHGHCEMNFTNFETKSHSEGRLVTRGGKRYAQLEFIKWNFDTDHKGSSSWFYNLFNGDKNLGDATNRFLNDNPKEAFEAIKHIPEEAFSHVFKDLSQRVYDAYTVDELLPSE